jgi:hypothetical protein
MREGGGNGERERERVEGGKRSENWNWKLEGFEAGELTGGIEIPYVNVGKVCEDGSKEEAQEKYDSVLAGSGV